MKRIFHGLFWLIEWTVTIVSVVMCLVVFFQVVLRYVLDQPFGWTEEMGRVTFLIFVMLGAALAYRDNRHLGLDIVENRLSPNVRLFFIAVKRALVILFAIVMIREGFNLVDSLYAFTPILSIPFSKLYLIFPITMILILILAIIQFGQDIRQIIRFLKSPSRAALLPANVHPGGKDPGPHLD